MVDLLVAANADLVGDLILGDVAVGTPDPFLSVHGLGELAEGREFRDENPGRDLYAVTRYVVDPSLRAGKAGPLLMTLAAVCGFGHDLMVIAIGPVLLLQLIALKLLIKQGLKGMPLGRVGKTIAIPVNGLPVQGRPLGQRNRRRDPALIQLAVAGDAIQRGEVFAPRRQRLVGDVGVTGSAIRSRSLFFPVDLMALVAGKALGFMDAGRVALEGLMVAGIACGTCELLLVRDLFNVEVAVRAGNAFVRGPFFEVFVAIETVVRQDGGPDGGAQEQKDDDKNRHNIPYRAREIINAGA